jgi:hypothetical protein
MSDSKTSFSHNSVWGANWLIAVESAPPKDFNDDEVRQALEENFGATPNAYADVLDYLREGCRMEFGSKDDSIATLIVGKLQALGLKARLVARSVEPHLKFPAWHSPAGAFLDPPLLVRVSGGSGAQDLDRSSSLISHISVMIPKAAVKEALAECRGKFYADFPAFYREHAESLSECLVEMGWTVTVVQSTERLMGS